ncbi:MAG TPA: hypothetical protein VLF87_03170 [Patescibacteria group bacterium]|nr:hypothetical protein [Patescibacteria group bacterium]
MEWNNGSGQPQPVAKPVNHAGSSKQKNSLLSLRTASVGLLFCVLVLVLALIGYVAISKPNSQDKYLDKGKMQAVFLNGGQVYFGNITNLNATYLRVTNIYYLRVNQQVQPDGSQSQNQDISLVKLGCELHGPDDSMVINQQQVIFWENLKTDGQVAKAVAEYKKQNPNGQNCNTTSNNSSSSTPASSTPASSTPASSSTTKKP